MAIPLGGSQLQACPAFLEGGFNRPPWCVTLDQLLRLHGEVRGEEILVTVRTCAIMDVEPLDFNERFLHAVPVPRARDDLDRSAGSPIPRHCEAAARGRVCHDLVGGGPFLAFDARAADRVARAPGRRFVQRGITIKLAHQGEVLAVARQTVGRRFPPLYVL